MRLRRRASSCHMSQQDWREERWCLGLDSFSLFHFLSSFSLLLGDENNDLIFVGVSAQVHRSLSVSLVGEVKRRPFLCRRTCLYGWLLSSKSNGVSCSVCSPRRRLTARSLSWWLSETKENGDSKGKDEFFGFNYFIFPSCMSVIVHFNCEC